MSIISRLFPAANDTTATQVDIDDDAIIAGDETRDGTSVDSAPTGPSGSRKRRGATVIELILYIGGAALVITGAILGYQTAKTSIEFSRFQSNLLTHASSLRGYLRKTSGDNPVLVSQSSGGKSPWGGDIHYFNDSDDDKATTGDGKYLIYSFKDDDDEDDCVMVVSGHGKISPDIVSGVFFSKTAAGTLTAGSGNTNVENTDGSSTPCSATASTDEIRSIIFKLTE